MLTAKRLREILDYNPETGEFTKKVGHRGRNGRIQVEINDKAYPRSRLAWLYVHGEWPPEQIDHIDGVRDNDRIANLRLATRNQNQANRKKSSNNTSGHKGVNYSPSSSKWKYKIRRKEWVQEKYTNHKPWTARISHNGKSNFLGRFSTRQQAAAAYKIAARKLNGEFARW